MIHPSSTRSSLSTTPAHSSPPHIPKNLATRRIVVWKDGVPSVELATQQVREIIPEVLVAALMEPFEDELGIYPEFVGLTKLEVMAKNMASNAALGGVDTVNQMLNRILGMPKQTSESKNLNVNYQDFLEELNRKTEEKNG